LARNYEFFFLKKNPRLTGNKKSEKKQSHSKQIIKYLSDEEIEIYKSLFIEKSIFYKPKAKEKEKEKEDLNKGIKEHKSIFGTVEFTNLKMDVNKDNNEEKEENKKNSLFDKDTKNENNINLDKVEENNEIQYKDKDEDNAKNSYINNASLKHSIFYIDKKASLNITKKNIDNNNKEQNNSKLANNNIINEQIYNSPLLISKNNILEFNNLNINTIYSNAIDRTIQKTEKEIQTENNLIHDDSTQNIEILL